MAKGWWSSMWDKANEKGDNAQVRRNRQYNEYLAARNAGQTDAKFQDWLDAGGGADVSGQTPSIADSSYVASSFLPGVGEAQDAAEAYGQFKEGDVKGGLTTAFTGMLGLIPGVGDAVATSARLARAAKKANIPDNVMKDAWETTHKNFNQMKKRAKQDPNSPEGRKVRDLKKQLGPNWERDYPDMELEATIKGLAENKEYAGPWAVRKQNESPRYPHPRWYKNYETKEGKNIHALYGPSRTSSSAGQHIGPFNIMGGTGEAFDPGVMKKSGNPRYPSQLEAMTIGNVSRPVPETFDLLGDRVPFTKRLPKGAERAINAPEEVVDVVEEIKPSTIPGLQAAGGDQQVALALLDRGVGIDEIAARSNLSKGEIKRLKKARMQGQIRNRGGMIGPLGAK